MTYFTSSSLFALEVLGIDFTVADYTGLCEEAGLFPIEDRGLNTIFYFAYWLY